MALLACGSSAKCCCVADLLDKICKLRNNEIAIDPDNFTVLTPSDRHAWARLFAEYFICSAHCTLPQCSTQADDMLWYVRSQAQSLYDSVVASGKKPAIEVFRRQSKKQPCPGDASIDWQETVYLNVILQQLEFLLTCAVCTKTSPQNLQILKKTTQRVYASPSRRRMDSKGEGEELAYPNIFFTVDGFEELFSDIIVRDGECICVELVARDKCAKRESTLFLGSIRYEVLKQVYDSKSTSGWGWAQKMLPASNRRLEFVRMRGPHGKGHAEMAVSRVVIPGYVTPTTEELPFEDFEVEAVKLEETVFGRLWGMRGFGQAWHWLKEKRRATSTPLNSYLTYVTCPWFTIVEDLLDKQKRPILTFGVEEASATPTFE